MLFGQNTHLNFFDMLVVLKCCPNGKERDTQAWKAVRKVNVCIHAWSMRLNENQLAKLHPVPRTKGVTERAPRDPQATVKHLEHLCCSKFTYSFLHLPLDIFFHGMDFVCQDCPAEQLSRTYGDFVDLVLNFQMLFITASNRTC